MKEMAWEQIHILNLLNSINQTEFIKFGRKRSNMQNTLQRFSWENGGLMGL
jgi:hypothetical protein